MHATVTEYCEHELALGDIMYIYDDILDIFLKYREEREFSIYVLSNHLSA